jgi:hypothetical protein
VPTSTVITTVFQTHARLAAKHLHIDKLPLLITPHPLNDLDADQIRALARACYPVVLEQLTGHGELEPSARIVFERPRKEK